MKNFKLHSALNRDSVYVISRQDNSYSFFKDEYQNLPTVNGNIIVPASIIDDRIITKKESLKEKLKRRILSGYKTMLIPAGSDEYMYYKTEYGNYYINDKNGYYIPTEFETKGKTR